MKKPCRKKERTDPMRNRYSAVIFAVALALLQMLYSTEAGATLVGHLRLNSSFLSSGQCSWVLPHKIYSTLAIEDCNGAKNYAGNIGDYTHWIYEDCTYPVSYEYVSNLQDKCHANFYYLNMRNWLGHDDVLSTHQWGGVSSPIDGSGVVTNNAVDHTWLSADTYYCGEYHDALIGLSTTMDFNIWYMDDTPPDDVTAPVFSGDQVTIATNTYDTNTQIDVGFSGGADANSGRTVGVRVTRSSDVNEIFSPASKWGACDGPQSASIGPSSYFNANIQNGYGYTISIVSKNGCTPQINNPQTRESPSLALIKIDTTAPTVAVDGVPSDWQQASANIATFCDDAPTAVDCSACGGAPDCPVAGCLNSGCDYPQSKLLVAGGPGACPGTYGSYNLTSPQTISAHGWMCAAGKDRLGHMSVSPNAVEIKADQVPPTVTVGGAPGAWQNTNAVASVGSCADGGAAGSGCDAATYKILTYLSNPGSCSTSYAAYVNANNFTITDHAWVCAAARDNVGNAGFSAPVEFKVDKITPPTVSVTGAPGTWQNTNASAGIACTDDVNGASVPDSGCVPATYKFKIDTSNIGACPAVEGLYTTAAPSTISSHVWICGMAKDAAGNVTYTAVPVEFKVDEIVPTTTISGMPGPWQKTDATASVNCGDTGDSVCDAPTYKIKSYGAVNPGTCSTNYGDYTLPNPSIINSHQWLCSAVKDVAGNIGYSTPYEFKVDEILPVMGTPAAYTTVTYFGSYYSGSLIDIRATSGDTGDSTLNLASCEYSIDDGASWLPANWDGAYCYKAGAPVAGEIRVKLRMRDVAGNTGESVASIYYQDNTAPDVSAGGVPPNWQNTDATVSLLCSDAAAGCDNATYRIIVYNYDPGACPPGWASYGGTTTPSAVVTEHSWVCVAARDHVNNMNYTHSPAQIKVDKTPPSINIGGAPGTWQNSNASASAGCSDTGDSGCDADSYKVSISTSNPGACPASYANYSLASPQPVEQHAWVCGAIKDIAGNVTVSSPVEFFIDKDAPALSAPEVYSANIFGTFYSGGAVDVRSQPGDGTGAGVDTATCEYSVNGGATYNPANWDGTYCYKQFVNVSGQIGIKFRAKDLAGNLGVSGATSYEQDNAPPASSLSALGQYEKINPFPVTWSGSDGSGSGLKNYDVQYKTLSSGAWTDWMTNTPLTSSPFNGADGETYFFQSRASDNLNNLEAYPGGNGDTFTKLDITAPNSSVTALPPFKTSATFPVTWTGADGADGSGVKNYDVQVKDSSGGAWTDWQTDTAQAGTSYTGADGHVYYFQSRAEDNAGNVELFPMGDGDAHTQIDTSAPASVVAPLALFQGSSVFTLNWSGSDGVGSGVKNYDVQFRDGASGMWMDLLSDTISTSFPFEGEDTHTYYFQSRSEDNLGNLEIFAGGDGQSHTTVDVSKPTSSVAALNPYQTTASFALNWSGGDGPLGSGVANYDVQVKDGDAGAWADHLAGTTLTTTTFNGADGHKYMFQSRAHDNIGNVEDYPDGNGDAETFVDVTAPVASVTSLSPYLANENIAVNWSGTDTGGSGVKVYDVQVRDGAAGAWTNWKTGTADTGATYAGADGHVYYFQARATDNAGNRSAFAGGDGDTHSTIDKTILPGPAVSDGAGADEDFTTTTTSLSANWPAVPGTAKYFYGIGTTRTSPDFVNWTDNGANTSVSVGSLSLVNGQKFYFFVKAQNPSGVDGQWGVSDGIMVDTAAPASSVYGMSEYVGSETFQVSWSGNDAGGSGVNSYDIQVKDGPAGAWTDWKTATTNTGANYTGVDGHTYYFQSRASDKVGNTDAYPGGDGDAHTTVDKSVPAAPAYVNDGPDADLEFASSSSTIKGNWAAVPGAVKYSYAVGLSATSTNVVPWTDQGANTSIAVGGQSLAENRKYYVHVKANNRSGIPGAEGVSNGVTIDTAPPTSSVQALASHQGNAAFALNWSGTDGGGSGIKSYDVQSRDGLAGAWTDVAASTMQTSAQFTGASGHTYYFRSRAQDNLGLQEEYPAGNGDTSTTIDTTPPTAAVLAAAQYQTSASFIVKWSGGDNAGGSGVKHYDIQVKDGAGGAWTDWLQDANLTEVAYTNGADGHTYFFQARAEDAVGNVGAYPGGNGQASTTVDISAPTASVTELTPYLSVTSFPVKWSGSDAGSGVQQYDVQYKDVSGSSGLFSAVWKDWLTGTALTESTFNGENGHTYYFQARARDKAGNQGAYRGGNGDTNTRIDTSKLASPAYIYDGTAADIDFTNSTAELSANWAPVQGAAKYFIGIGTATDTPNVATWTENGPNTSANVQGLSLADGTKYYFLVRAQNFAGVEGIVSHSNGVTVDTAAPVCTVAQLSPYLPTETFNVSWSGADGSGSGIKKYDVKVKDGATGTWTDWQTAKTTTSADYQGADKHTYYFECRALDNVGNQEQYAAGDGETRTTIDKTIPAAPASISDGDADDIDYSTSTDEFTASWTAVPGAAKYLYSISTGAGTELVPWTDNAASTSFALTGLSLVSGTKYVVKVKAQNTSGVDGPVAQSDGVTIDTTPPSKPSVSDSGDVTNDPTKLTSRWSADDAQSPVVEYVYAIGTAPGSEDIVPFTTNNAGTEITRTNLALKDGNKYYISAKARNAAGLWSDFGASDGIMYQMTTVTVTVTTLPQLIEIAPDEEQTVKYRFDITGNSGIKLDTEKVYYELPTREIDLGRSEIDLSVAPSSPRLEFDRKIKFETDVVSEALGGGQSAKIIVKRIFTGRDDENREVAVEYSVPVTIKTVTSVTQALAIETVALALTNADGKLEIDSVEKPRLTVKTKGVSNRVSGRIVVNGSKATPINFIAGGGGKTEVFELPPLNTSNDGPGNIKVVVDSPNYMETDAVPYEVFIPKLPYAVDDASVTATRTVVMKGDTLTAVLGIKVSGAGGEVRGAAMVNGAEWQNFTIPIEGTNDFVYFDSPPLPSGKEGEVKISLKINYPNKIESKTLAYNVVNATNVFPAKLPLPHANVAYLMVKDDAGNVLVNYRQNADGVSVWSKNSQPVDMYLPGVGAKNKEGAIISESEPVTFTYAGDNPETAVWKMTGGQIKIDNAMETKFNVLGVTALEKKSGQTAPLITIDKDGLSINGVGKLNGIQAIEFNGLKIMASSPARIIDGQAVIDADKLYLVISAEHEKSPQLFTLVTKPAPDTKILLYASTKLSGKLIVDKAGIHFPNISAPVDFNYSYGEYKFPDQMKVEFSGDFVVDMYAEDPSKQIKGGRILFTLADGTKVNLAEINKPDGFVISPDFWGMMIARSIPEKIGLPESDIMYVKMRDKSGNPLVDVNVNVKDSFSQALRVNVWSKPGTSLGLYIPALQIDENNDDDTDAPLPLTVAKDAPLVLVCSPDCSKPENWKVSEGDISLSSLPTISYSGVKLNISKLSFAPARKMLKMSGDIGLALGESNNSYTVPFSDLTLSNKGIVGTVKIDGGSFSSPFSYSGTKFSLTGGAVFFENTKKGEFYSSWSKNAEVKIAGYEQQKSGIATKKQEMERSKKMYEDLLADMSTEKSLLQPLAAQATTADGMAAAERIKSLDVQINLTKADIAKLDKFISDGSKLAASLDQEMQKLQSSISSYGSAGMDGSNMSVVYITDMSGKITSLPMFGDLSSKPVDFEGFYVVYDPGDAFKPKINGMVTLGENKWYSENSNRVFRLKQAPEGTPLFAADMWNGRLGFSIYYAMLKLQDNRLADAGFSGALKYKPGDADKYMNSIINIAYDPFVSVIQGTGLIPDLDPVTMFGMNIDVDGGYANVVYSMGGSGTSVDFYGLLGYMRDLPNPIGTLSVPVMFQSARIGDTGFSGLISNLPTSLPLRSFKIMDSGSDKVSADLTSVNLQIENNQLVRGSLSAAIRWTHDHEDYTYGGTLKYAPDGSISGDATGINLPSIKVDGIAAVKIDDGKVSFSVGAGGNTFAIKDLSGKLSMFPFMDEYDAGKTPIKFQGCAWNDSGFQCDILHNSDASCEFSGGTVFSKSFYDQKQNPDFSMAYDVKGVCAKIENSRIEKFIAGGAATLKHKDPGSGEETIVYSKDVNLTLEKGEDGYSLKGARDDVAAGKFSHEALSMDVASGKLEIALNKDEATAELTGLNGKIYGLPGMDSLAADPIDYTDFAIGANGLAGMIESEDSPIVKQAVMFGAPVSLSITKMRFAPAAFAVSATVSVPVESKDKMPSDVQTQTKDECYSLDINVSNAGFLYKEPMAINYGGFSTTLPCGTDFAVSPDGFVAGMVMALPPIPLPAYNKAYLQLKSQIVLTRDGDAVVGKIKDLETALHLTYSDENFPTALSDIEDYNKDNPDSHRVVNVKVGGEVTVKCQLDDKKKPRDCTVDAFPDGASIAADISPPLVFDKVGFNVELSHFEYGSGEACGVQQKFVNFSAKLKRLPGIGEVGEISFEPLYLVSNGLCGTVGIDLPEITLAGFGLDINKGKVEFTATADKQSFAVKSIEGVVTKVPGFDLSQYSPTFSATIDGDDYEYSFSVSNMDLKKTILGVSLGINSVSATITPENKKVEINASVSLPENLKYAKGTISATAWAEYVDETKDVNFGIKDIAISDVELNLFDVAKLSVGSGHYEEDEVDGNHFVIDDATLWFKIGDKERDVTFNGMRIYKNKFEVDQIDVDETFSLGFFNFTVGKIAFVKPAVGKKYVTMTGDVGLDFGATKIGVGIPELGNFKVFEDYTMSLSAIKFAVETPAFTLDGMLYFSDMPNDTKIEVIKPPCKACADVFSENIYLQDTDEEKDFLGNVQLSVTGLFSLEATVAILSNKDFGVYLAASLPPPGITPVPPVPISITGVFGGIMYRNNPKMFAFSFGGDVEITGMKGVVQGKAAITAVFGTPTLFNLCAGLYFGKMGDKNICEASGSATIFFTGYKGFLGTLYVGCQVPPDDGSIVKAEVTANLCFREKGGCTRSHQTDVISECFKGEREEQFSLNGNVKVLSILNADIQAGLSDGIFDAGVNFALDGEIGDTDIVGVWYYLHAKGLLCKLGGSGTWGKVHIEGGAGVSVVGIDIATIDIVGGLDFYTSPWKFRGYIGGGACLGLYCGREVCEGCVGDCCPHNPGKLRSADCGKTSACLDLTLFRVVGALSLEITLPGTQL